MKKGFTLAEVLITLAIIGVVAAMTVPALMTSTRGKEYEVGAQKAMSTLANSMQMRYAMDGQSLADWPCPNCLNDRHNLRIFRYLTEVPAGARPGEQPALPTTNVSVNHAGIINVQDDMPVYKLKDGMLLIVPLWMGGGTPCPGGAGANGRVHYVAVDTNGEKGPTRLNHDTRYNGSGNAADANACSIDGANLGIWFSLTDARNGTTYSFRDLINEAPQNDQNPDVVVFAIDPHTGTIKPAGQRTRNILVTGNSLIAQ